MAKRNAEEMEASEVAMDGEKAREKGEDDHPYAFHVSGPRNVSSPNWRDLINSSWSVLSLSLSLSLYIYIYICVCVCVCVHV